MRGREQGGEVQRRSAGTLGAGLGMEVGAARKDNQRGSDESLLGDGGERERRPGNKT